MAYTTIDNPELYFQCKLYTGNGGTQSITLDGSENMEPDLVWTKLRSTGTYPHVLTDSVRGATKNLYANLTDGEDASSNYLTSFDSNGFSIGSYAGVNLNSNTLVAWCWKETATAGFDIVSYTGNATVRTISHSLSAVPHFIIIKNRDFARSWLVGSKGLPSWSYHLYLDTNDDQNSDNNMFNGTTPTSSVFSLGNADEGNQNADKMIAYLFSEKQGFSKFGSFEGNNNANGAFVYLGFRPAWVMIKSSATGGSNYDWVIFDNKRNTGNVSDNTLDANNNGAEVTSGRNEVDFLSNGFKCRSSYADVNSNTTYIFMAFAEQPFVNSNGVPANAR